MRIKDPRAIIALAVVVAALVLAPAASAWTWGYNNIGPVYNTTVVAGWSYWDWTYADKRNGGAIYRNWRGQGGDTCDHYMYGITDYYSTPYDCGIGGYCRLEYGYYLGSKSYTYLEAA